MLMTQVQRRLPPLQEQPKIDSIRNRLNAARALARAYPPKERDHYLGILADMATNLARITHTLRALPDNTDKRDILSELSTLDTKLGEFQDRLQLLHPPSVSFAVSLRPLAEGPAAAPEPGSLLAAALEILNNSEREEKAADLKAYCSERSIAFRDAINAHFKEGNMVPVIQLVSDCLNEHGVYLLLHPSEPGKPQKITLIRPSEDFTGFHEEEAGWLLQPTEQEPEKKSFSLRLESSQLTGDPLGWLASYYRIFGIALHSSDAILAQQAVQKGISSMSFYIGRGGLITEISVTFSDSSTQKFCSE